MLFLKTFALCLTLAAARVEPEGPTLIHYDCPSGCCYGVEGCNPPGSGASFAALQTCLDAINDPTCLFSTWIYWVLAGSDVIHPGSAYEMGCIFDGSRMWETFPELEVDPVRLIEVRGFHTSCNKVNCCHERGVPTGDCSIIRPTTPEEADGMLFMEYDFAIMDSGTVLYHSADRWEPAFPTITFVFYIDGGRCMHAVYDESDVHAKVWTKLRLTGGERLPDIVLNR